MIQKITLLSTKTCFGVFSKTNDTSTHTTSSGKPDLCHPWEFFLSWYQQLSNGHFLGIFGKLSILILFSNDDMMQTRCWSQASLLYSKGNGQAKEKKDFDVTRNWIKMFLTNYISCRKDFWQKILCLVRGVTVRRRRRKTLLKKGGKKCFRWVM